MANTQPVVLHLTTDEVATLVALVDHKAVSVNVDQDARVRLVALADKLLAAGAGRLVCANSPTFATPGPVVLEWNTVHGSKAEARIADVDLPGCGRNRWTVQRDLSGQWVAVHMGPAALVAVRTMKPTQAQFLAAAADTHRLGEFEHKDAAMERCRIDAHTRRAACAERTPEGRR